MTDSRLGLLERALNVVNASLRRLELLGARDELFAESGDAILSSRVLEFEVRELFGRLGDTLLEAAAKGARAVSIE